MTASKQRAFVGAAVAVCVAVALVVGLAGRGAGGDAAPASLSSLDHEAPAAPPSFGSACIGDPAGRAPVAPPDWKVVALDLDAEDDGLVGHLRAPRSWSSDGIGLHILAAPGTDDFGDSPARVYVGDWDEDEPLDLDDPYVWDEAIQDVESKLEATVTGTKVLRGPTAPMCVVTGTTATGRLLAVLHPAAGNLYAVSTNIHRGAPQAVEHEAQGILASLVVERAAATPEGER